MKKKYRLKKKKNVPQKTKGNRLGNDRYGFNIPKYFPD